jgi:SAM-dependent methyltransferase
MNRPDPTTKLLDLLQRSLADDTFISLQLTQPQPTEARVQRIAVRLIELKTSPHLSITTHESKQDFTRNLDMPAGMEWVKGQLDTAFRTAWLRTTRQDWQWHRPVRGAVRLVRHRPKSTIAPSRGHDQRKQSLVDAGARDWLQALGILDGNGHLRASMADKHRQVSHYVELLHHLARDCGWAADASSSADGLTFVDMGCGKGYLTFAAWHLFHRILHRPAQVLGVEQRADLLKEATRVAHRVRAKDLEFIAGDIATARIPRLDGLIALHACNTATDDAIRRGIDLGARLILVAPCCHQALRSELGNPPLFDPLLRHGLLKERLAEWLTDGLRTLYLEWAGYETKVLEFVASEHTPKNLMIAAIRKRAPFSEVAAQTRIHELKAYFGIQRHALDPLLR